MILYQGYKPNMYYWEFVNTLRKALILISYTIFSMFSFTYKIMATLIILVITFRIQIYFKPYKKDAYNDIEILAILSGVLTLSFGLIYASDDDQQAMLNLILFTFVVIANFIFIMKWSYLYIICMSDRYSTFKRILMIINLII